MLLLSQVWLLVPAVDENADAHPVEDEKLFQFHFKAQQPESLLQNSGDPVGMVPTDL